MARTPDSQNLSFILINDFSPGIYDDYHVRGNAAQSDTVSDKGIVVQPGAATVDDTYRCCADRAGALVPLPKLIAGKTSIRFPTGANTDILYPSGDETSYLLDAMVRNEMFDYDENNSDDEDRTGVFTMYGQGYETPDNADYRWTVIAQFHRLFDGSTSVEKHDIMFARAAQTLYSVEGDEFQIGAGNFIPYRSRVESVNNTPADIVVWVAYASPGYNTASGTWESGTIPTATAALTDYDTYTNSVYPGNHQRIIGAYPDPKAPGDSDSGFLGGSHLGTSDVTFKEACHLISHQGRMVALTRSLRDHGEDSDNLTTWGRITEEVHYSPPQDFYGELGIGCFEVASWAEEKPYRTGAAASITADQLILIKDKGGAIMARGDLSQPTIVQLPYVESTHGARCIPALTPLGLVYGSSNGIHLWEGGETSRLISEQIEGWFWNHAPTKTYLGNRGRMSWWSPWVCVPNNFMYDTRNGSWWRLAKPSDHNYSFNVYDVAEISNRLYAFPHQVEDRSVARPMWYTADPDTLADTYSWQSHPIVESRLRAVSIQEIELVVTPSSTDGATVDVTLTGFEQDGTAVTPRTVTFTCAANTNTQIIHMDVRDGASLGNFIATHVQIKLEANSNNTSIPAPKIHSVKLTENPRARVAKTRPV